MVIKNHLRYILKEDALRLKSQNFYDNFEKIISEKEVKNKKERLKKSGYEKLNIDELEEIINDEVIEKIEQDLWIKLREKFDLYLDLILYDTTPFITHIDKFTDCSIPQIGHNSKGIKNKRQIKLVLAFLKRIGFTHPS